MQTLTAVFFVLSLVSAGMGSPIKEPRFMFMPDGEGKLHLVDLQAVDPTRKALDASSDVTLNLYTASNPTTAEIIKIENSYIPSTFNKNAETRFIIHGWNSKASNFDSFRSAYLAENQGINVVLVDWSGPAAGLYTSAKSATTEVGAYVAKVINYLVSNGGASLSKIQLAGHSLGAHIAGIAGNALGGKLPRITGMDPAAPLYGSESLANRLDSTDAAFVQVIHTCANVLGWADAMGTADFYPNGGTPIQPGCGVDLGGACSHGRSHQYFAESITSDNFTSRKCASYSTYTSGGCSSNAAAKMGEHVSTSASGSYYLTTNSNSPYAQG